MDMLSSLEDHLRITDECSERIKSILQKRYAELPHPIGKRSEPGVSSTAKTKEGRGLVLRPYFRALYPYSNLQKEIATHRWDHQIVDLYGALFYGLP